MKANQAVHRVAILWPAYWVFLGRQAPDLVARNFMVEAPDALWVADITYIRIWAGFLYLAGVLDVWSRPVVG